MSLFFLLCEICVIFGLLLFGFALGPSALLDSGSIASQKIDDLRSQIFACPL